ncbi:MULTISPECIES: hypothetical protein [Nocardia]|uniref:hypothetical protein n=1 Tax=Nocardia TaxID=1817 RepID=UPI0024588D9A|nr:MULTISPECIES: hypothetical protein [Nocardia]
MSDNEIDAYHPDFDLYMPDEHRIEDAVKVYMVFEDGRWCLDGLIQQSDPLDELTGTRCSYEQPREDCVVCSTPHGLAVVEAADRASMPNGRELLAMLAEEFGYVLVPAAMAGPGPQITRLSEQVQQLLDKRSEVDELGDKLADAFVGAVELSTYLNTATRRGRLRAMRTLIAHLTGKPAT